MAVNTPETSCDKLQRDKKKVFYEMIEIDGRLP